MTKVKSIIRNSICVLLMTCMVMTMFPVIGNDLNGFTSGQVYAASASDLSGDQRADILKIAKSCQGMKLKATKKQLKKYGKKLWKEGYKDDWCAWFISNCAVEAGVKKSVFPRSTVAGSTSFGKYKKKGSYTPKPGDVALFGSPGKTYHVELVYSVKKGTVKTIGGNTGAGYWKNAVVSKPQAKSGIYGYVPINYATVKANHTFSYNLNGGSGSFSAQTVKDGGTLTIPAKKPTKAGYDFQGFFVKRNADNTWYVANSGWVSEKNLSGKTRTLYQPGRSYTINASWTKGSAKSSYTFYAQWKVATATVKFNANGGAGSMSQRTVNLNVNPVKISTINGFTKEGYSFNGWNVQLIRNGKQYWIVPNGDGWKWKENAAVNERKLYANVDMISFGNSSLASGDTLVFWASWMIEEPEEEPIVVSEEFDDVVEDIDEEVDEPEEPTVQVDEPVEYGSPVVVNEDESDEPEDEPVENDPPVVVNEEEPVVPEDEPVENDPPVVVNEEEPVVPEDEPIENDPPVVVNEDEPVVVVDEKEPVYVWSEWSGYSTTPVTATDTREVQTVKEYRYRDKQTTTSGEASLSGWTKYDTKTSVAMSGYKFGSPIATSTSMANNKKTVTSAVDKGYYYYAYVVANPSKTSDWCYYADKTQAKVVSHMKANFSSSSAWAEKRLRYFWYISSKDLGATSGKINKTISYCADSSVSVGTLSQTGTHYYDLPMFRYKQCYKVKTETTTNYFYKWGNWSAWSGTAYSGSDSRQVETRILYRYRDLVEE